MKLADVMGEFDERFPAEKAMFTKVFNADHACSDECFIDRSDCVQKDEYNCRDEVKSFLAQALSDMAGEMLEAVPEPHELIKLVGNAGTGDPETSYQYNKLVQGVTYSRQSLQTRLMEMGIEIKEE